MSLNRISKHMIDQNFVKEVDDIKNNKADKSEITRIDTQLGQKASKVELEKNNAYYHEVSVSKHHDEQSNTDYYLTLIKHTDEDGNIIKLKQGIIDDGVGETVRSFANRNNATVAINTMTFDIDNTYKILGTYIVDGVIKKNAVVGDYCYILGIKNDNTFVIYPPDTPAQTILNEGCVNALTGFIPLVENGSMANSSLFELFHFPEKHPRQAIAQLSNKDILILTCGGRGREGDGMTGRDVARILIANKVVTGYMLDGGGSTQTVVRGTMINKSTDRNGNSERPVPAMLYISKDVPTNKDKDIVISNKDIGELKRNIDVLDLNISKMGSLSSDLENNRNINEINKTGIYWGHVSGKGIPSNDYSWGIIHFQIGTSAMQIAFPFTSNASITPKLRRTSTDGSGNWDNWRNI